MPKPYKPKKKMPQIAPMTITLTAEEVLGLRYIHSHWANSNGEAPFCDVASNSFLEKIGGYLDIGGRPLDEHPLAKKWYELHEGCSVCGRMFEKSDLTEKEEEDFSMSWGNRGGRELWCKGCIKDSEPEVIE